MPSPIGHALGGAIVNVLMAPKPRGTWDLGPGAWGSALVIAAAVAPDIDFLWGGHNRETHSLGAALIAGAIVLAWKRNPRLAIAVAVSWSTHVLFDWLGSDDTPPLGVLALWPLDSNFYFANAFIFEAISRRYWLDNFVTHNTWAVIKEIIMLGPVWLIASRWRARRRFRRPGTT